MAAVIDIDTGNRVLQETRPKLTLIEGGLAARERSTCKPNMARIYFFRRVLAVLVVGVLAMAVVGVVRTAVGLLSGKPPMVVTHVVTPGESLWSIARSAQPDGDPRHTIDQIVDVNSTKAHIFDPFEPISVGQEILIPLKG